MGTTIVFKYEKCYSCGGNIMSADLQVGDDAVLPSLDTLYPIPEYYVLVKLCPSMPQWWNRQTPWT